MVLLKIFCSDQYQVLKVSSDISPGDLFTHIHKSFDSLKLERIYILQYEVDRERHSMKNEHQNILNTDPLFPSWLTSLFEAYDVLKLYISSDPINHEEHVVHCLIDSSRGLRNFSAPPIPKPHLHLQRNSLHTGSLDSNGTITPTSALRTPPTSPRNSIASDSAAFTPPSSPPPDSPLPPIRTPPPSPTRKKSANGRHSEPSSHIQSDPRSSNHSQWSLHSEPQQHGSSSWSLPSALHQQTTSLNTSTSHSDNPHNIPKNWTLGQLLGKGAYAKVYLGLNNDTGELFAVKQFDVEAAENDDVTDFTENDTKKLIAAYAQEIEVLKQLDHKNIIAYLGTELKGDILNVFMEYGAGGSIASLLKKFGPFSENMIRVYSKQILEGISYLHDCQIIHRDIKGANLLINTKGCVKLSDFGCSKLFSRPLDTMGQRTSGGDENLKTIMGTPYWMAPEVIQQAGHGRPADIWSFGCTVLEMSTGRSPWAKQRFPDGTSALYHIASSDDIPDIPSYLSPVLADFILSCLRRDPQVRWDAPELLQHPFFSQSNSQSQPQQVYTPPNTSPHLTPHTSPIITRKKTPTKVIQPNTFLLYKLPLAVIKNILKFLSIDELFIFRSICKDCRVLFDDPLLWEYLTKLHWNKRNLLSTETGGWKEVFLECYNNRQKWIKREFISTNVKASRKPLVCIARGPGDIVATAGEDHHIKLWNVARLKRLQRLKGHDATVSALAFSPHTNTADQLLSGSFDTTVKLWDCRDSSKAKLLTSFESDAHGKITALLFDNNLNNRIATCSENGTFCLWDIENASEPVHITSTSTDTSINTTFHALAHGTHTIFTGCGDGSIRLWDIRLPGGGLLQIYPLHRKRITRLCFNEGENLIVSCSLDHTIKKFDIRATNRTETSAFTHDGGVLDVAFDHSKLLSASQDKTIRLWDTHQHKCIRTFEGHTRDVVGFCFDPEGSIYSVGRDRMLRIWTCQQSSLAPVPPHLRPASNNRFLRGRRVSLADIVKIPHFTKN